MKKTLILAAAAALALAACSKNEVVSVSPNTGETKVINFTNYAPKSLTKANEDFYASGATLIADADFDVYGWYTANGTSFTGSNGTKFMDWYTVTYKANGNSDGTKNHYPDGYRYWPSGDTPDYLHFYAYYPSNATGINAPTAGLGAYSFTAQSTAATMVDFMVADVVKDQVYDNTNSSTDGTVNLTFKHMLTKVQFRFKTTEEVENDANTTIQLTDAKLYNVLTTGTLTSAYDGTNTTTTWSAQGTPSATPYEIFIDGADINNKVLTKTAYPASEVASDVFLMVPQEMVTPTFTATPHNLANTSNKAQALVVEWDVIDAANSTTIHNIKTLFFKTDLKTTDNITSAASNLDLDWDKNNSIIYTITIGPKPILFTAEVTGWDAETNGFFNVQ